MLAKAEIRIVGEKYTYIFSGDMPRSHVNNAYRTYQEKMSEVRWLKEQEMKEKVVSGTTGAKSVGTVNVTRTQTVPKPPVLNAVFSRGKSFAKTVGRGATALNPYGRAASVAFALVDALATQQGFIFDKEKGDWFKPEEEGMFKIETKKASSEGFHKHVITGDLGVHHSSVVQKVADDYCKTVSFGGNDYDKDFKMTGVGNWSGYCSDGFRMASRGVVITPFEEPIPFTKEDFDKVAEAAADLAVSKWISAAGMENKDDWSKPTVLIMDGAVAQTPPYTDPRDGKVKQTTWDFETPPDAPASKVRETTVERPDLDPDSPQAPRTQPPANTGSGTGTGTGDDTGTGDGDKDKDGDKDDDDPENGTGSGTGIGSGDKNPTETEDLCEKHPDILACQQMGTVEDGFFDDISIPHVTDDRTWSEDNFLPSNGVCPAPKSFNLFGKPIYISYEPLCRFLQQVRFMILAAFIFMSAMLVFGSLRKE